MTRARTPGRGREGRRHDAGADLPDDVLVPQVVRIARHLEDDRTRSCRPRPARRRPGRRCPGSPRCAGSELGDGVLRRLLVGVGSRRRRARGRMPVGYFAFSRLIAWTLSSESGNAEKSACPRWSRITGSASTTSRPPLDDGRRSPAAASRRGRRRPDAAALRAAPGRGTGSGRGSTPSPRIASVAGRNVSEPTTETRTTAIVPTAIDRKSGSSSRNRPAIEIITASPEKKTARPAVALDDLDRAELRAAVPPLGPEAGDHEQRVVDRDGQPDQDDELARVRADRARPLAVEREDAERRQERGHREDERDDRRDERAERDQQDHERDREREQQRLVEAAVDQLADLVVGERVVQGVDLEVRMRGAELVERRRDRLQPLGRGPRRRRGPAPTIRTVRLVGRDQARPAGGAVARVDELLEDRAADVPSTVDWSAVQAGDDVLDGGGGRRIVDRAAGVETSRRNCWDAGACCPAAAFASP